MRRRTALAMPVALLVSAAPVLPVVAGASGCRNGDPARRRQLRIATGPAGAVYRRVGGGLAQLIDQRVAGAEVDTLTSRASVDNIAKLRSGEAELGLSSLDAVVDAEGDPPAGITAVCRLYDSYLHVVVLADSPVRRLSDLAGRRVSFGAVGSGTEFTAERLAGLLDLELRVVRLDQAESARAVEHGRIDAQFSLTGIPTPAIGDLAERIRIRLIDLPGAADALATAFPGPYVPATIPATAYAGVGATPTVAIPNVLLARADLPRDLVHDVTGAIFTGAGSIATHIPEAHQINIRTAIATGPVPLHPGAADWFTAQKR